MSSSGDLAKKIEEEILKDAERMYSERTIDEAYHPKNVGKIQDANGIGKVTGPCGDTMQIYLKIVNNKIIDSKFLTDGCGTTIACGSVITELVKNKTTREASKVESESIISILGGLPKENLHCSALAVNTLKVAIDDYNLTSLFLGA